MKIVFFIKSNTVDLTNYNIKDIPGSSGRLDVISRVILATLMNNYEIEKDIQIWIFLDRYGVLKFDSNKFSIQSFPTNEIKLTDKIVQFIRNIEMGIKRNNNFSNSIEFLQTDIFFEIKRFLRNGYKIFVLKEDGAPYLNSFRDLTVDDKVLFILGDQSGKLLESEDLENLNLIKISIGEQSYLASSVIRLIKLLLLKS